MNSYDFYLMGEKLSALGSGGLFWGDKKILCVSDLHLGKAHRLNRDGAGALPPYENIDTLKRLQADICATNPSCVICLGDSFDDPLAERSLDSVKIDLLKTLQKDRDWIWISGNHDPYSSYSYRKYFNRKAVERSIITNGRIGRQFKATVSSSLTISGEYSH